MIVGRPISEICRELAASAETDHQPILAQILRMASLEAARAGTRHQDDTSIRDQLVGTWDWDIANDRVYADSRFARLFGVNADLASRGTPLHTRRRRQRRSLSRRHRRYHPGKDRRLSTQHRSNLALTFAIARFTTRSPVKQRARQRLVAYGNVALHFPLYSHGKEIF